MFGVSQWQDSDDFLKQVAIKKGKLRKGGEPDVDATAKIILVNWQRGDIPYFNLPEGQVDRMDIKNEQTINDVKEEDFLKLVGAPVYQLENIEKVDIVDDDE